MFFRKNERKSRGTCVILAIGALAAIGAVSITRTGKQMLNEACCKVKGFFAKTKSMCPTDTEDC